VLKARGRDSGCDPLGKRHGPSRMLGQPKVTSVHMSLPERSEAILSIPGPSVAAVVGAGLIPSPTSHWWYPRQIRSCPSSRHYYSYSFPVGPDRISAMHSVKPRRCPASSLRRPEGDLLGGWFKTNLAVDAGPHPLPEAVVSMTPVGGHPRRPRRPRSTECVRRPRTQAGARCRGRAGLGKALGPACSRRKGGRAARRLVHSSQYLPTSKRDRSPHPVSRAPDPAGAT
jgi:hypothetical protein